VLQSLRDRGNTILVIEHNLDVIKACDWIVDLGPDGGDGGGQIVATGTPEEIASNKNSATGIYLKRHLGPLTQKTARKKSTAKKSAAKRPASKKSTGKKATAKKRNPGKKATAK